MWWKQNKTKEKGNSVKTGIETAIFLACKQAHLWVTRERQRAKWSIGKESGEFRSRLCSNVSLLAGYDILDLLSSSVDFLLCLNILVDIFC